MRRKCRYFVGDFETTVFKGQIATEVWASASVELFTEDVQIFHSLEEQFKYLVNQNDNIVIYYHNLKFDGGFWLPFLMQYMGYEQAFINTDKDNPYKGEWEETKNMKNNTFKYSISEMGQWYNIIIKVNNRIIDIRDSLKLLPFSVERIAKSFKTKHQKLHNIEYKGFRYSGCEITEEERKYIANDVLVIKEALEIMHSENHKELTIGACCLKEFKNFYGKQDYEEFFPDISLIELDKEIYGSINADEYIRKSYKGGWCYLVKGKENKIYKNGSTADGNSLYPSVMSSESGNRYPVGIPHFWKGNLIPDEALASNRYYFIRIRTRFKIKHNKLPFIQIKKTFLYDGTENLETSDFKNIKTGEYTRFCIMPDGSYRDSRVTLTLTMTDYKLLLEHYDLFDYEILDGCWFFSEIGLFDNYIEKYKKIKVESTGAKRELAKLFLNNLYGKMASNDNSSFKVAFVKEDKTLGFAFVSEHNKKIGYIPIGSAITSYARNTTIRIAQANYYGLNERGFIYADTDSVHCDLEPHELKGFIAHDTDFCCWKIESYWDKAYFTRQKTYIEHITKESKKGELVEVEPYYNIKCAGMPEKCKELFRISMQGYEEKEGDNYTEEELEFIKVKREMTDFKIGLIVPGKLRPKRVQGGIILVETPYEMRG